MHKYELIFIVRTDLPDDEIDKVVSQMEGHAVAANAKIEKIEKLGRRRLAYRVGRYREGFYILFVFEGDSQSVAVIERRLKVTDTVIKFLTVRIDEEQKRAAKRAKERAKKSARARPAKASPGPAASAAESNPA